MLLLTAFLAAWPAFAQNAPPSNDRLFDLRGPAVERPDVPASEAQPLQKPVPAAAGPALVSVAPRQAPPLDPNDWDALTEAMSDPTQGPQALQILSRAVKDGRGGARARQALHDGLQRLAELSDADKLAFVKGLDDPMAIVVPLAVSRVPHSFEAHVMTDKLWRLLASSGTTLSAFMEAEGVENLSGILYLRLNAYDRLHAYLNQHPDEAKPIAEAVFKNVQGLRGQAYAIQALAERITGPQTTAAARQAFGEGALDALDELPRGRSRALALLLSMYGDRFGALAPKLEVAAADTLPEGPTVGVSTSPDYASWPDGPVRASFHFSQQAAFDAAQTFFAARGYKVERTDAEGVHLAKDGPRRIELTWKLYPSDDKGFLLPGQLPTVVAAVQKDLLDPSYQVVFIRAHSELPESQMLSKGASPGKIYFDGSCRSSIAFAQVAGECRQCSLVGNVGGGDSVANDRAGAEVLDGLAARESWAQLQARIKAVLPSSYGRFLGPWAPPFPQALSRLRID